MNNYVNKKSEEFQLNQGISTYSSSITTGDMIGYAIEMADIHIKKLSSKNLDFEKEVKYMYLAHFVDISTPYQVSSLSQHSNSGELAMWMTDYCRQCYDDYMLRGSALDISANLSKFILFGLSLRNGLNTEYSKIDFNLEKENIESIKDNLSILATGLNIDWLVKEILDFVYYESGLDEGTTQEEFEKKWNFLIVELVVS